ncbi:ribonuclease H-like domain-containing protein [Hyaloraphidium curvatum]|nr:ribonuclease H-like domain-containing protein [Hyaloraphidium curvatum]
MSGTKRPRAASDAPAPQDGTPRPAKKARADHPKPTAQKPAPASAGAAFVRELANKRGHDQTYSHPLPISSRPILSVLYPSTDPPKGIAVHYTSSPERVDAFLDSLPPPPFALGFDTESRPVFRKGQPANPPCCVQLATEREALVVHIRHEGGGGRAGSALTPKLRALLEDPRVLKVGVGAVEDGEGLRLSWKVAVKGCINVNRAAEYFTGERVFGETKHERLVRFEQERLIRRALSARESESEAASEAGSTVAASEAPSSEGSFAESLSTLAASADEPFGLRQFLPGYGLKNLTAFFLDTQLAKPKSISRSNWERFPLTTAQLDYAALDAWISLMLFVRVKDLAGLQNMRLWHAEHSKHGHFY